MRVIAGAHGGRRLHAPRGRHARPTADRVREAMFSILGDTVTEARVLDLYAGTGALAIEAISRGAREAVCVERDPASLAALGRNVAELGLGDRVAVMRGDVPAQARRIAREGERFDLVFCDPPYRAPLEPVREVLGGSAWTAALVLEHAAETAPPEAPPGARTETRRYGDTAITFYWR